MFGEHQASSLPHSLGHESIVRERRRSCFPSKPMMTCVCMYVTFHICTAEMNSETVYNGRSLDLTLFSFQEMWLMQVGNSSSS